MTISRLSTLVLAAVFAIAVTCAVVCPERTIEHSAEADGTCTDCVSTAFFADGKASVDSSPLHSATLEATSSLFARRILLSLHTRTPLVRPPIKERADAFTVLLL